MDYPAVASLNVALGNEAALHALRQQQTCYTRVGDSMLRVMREAAREKPWQRKRERLACIGFSDSLALSHDLSVQALQAQVSRWQLMYDACGQPAWAKPWGDYLQQEIRNTSRFFTALGRASGGLAYAGLVN